MRAVIAAGYQFPFLFQDRPQHAGVSPSEQAGATLTSTGEQKLLLNGRATETKQLFAFLMQRQTESTLNMSEITFTTSGPARKAKNYFLFCFLRKLHGIACGLCPSFLKWGQIQVNSIERKPQVHKGPADQRGPVNIPKVEGSQLSSQHQGKADQREGTRVTARVHLASVWGQVYSKLP